MKKWVIEQREASYKLGDEKMTVTISLPDDAIPLGVEYMPAEPMSEDGAKPTTAAAYVIVANPQAGKR